jgi:phosphate transport system permease protein
MAGRGIVAPEPTQEAVRRALRGQRVDVRGGLFQAGLLAMLLVAIVVLLVLLADVVRVGLPVLLDRGSDFFTNGTSSLPERAGIAQGIVGSVTLMVFVAVLAFPLGIGAAIYMEEYAKDTRITRFINANVRNLAGVPAIVYGLLGLAIFVELLGSLTGPDVAGKSLLSGGLTISVMVLPIIVITTQEALRAVPATIREAGFGVGATRWEVIRSHVLPYAAPGILTGTVLSMARALGETAPLIMVGAVTGFFVTGSTLENKLYGRFTSLPTLIFSWVKKPQDEFQQLVTAVILVLMAAIFFINLLAILLRNRYERTW